MKYQRLDNFQKHNNSYNWEQGCHYCKGKFEEDEKFTRFDVQTSYMRGDDEVYCFHKPCQQKGLEMLQKLYE